MDPHVDKRTQILNVLQTKGVVKINCLNKSHEVFQELKNLLHEVSGDLNEELPNIRALRVEYRDKGKFESHVQFGDDVLIFNMHTDIFQFDNQHPVCETPYAKQSENNTLCTIINIYNFLTNSFKYNRENDEGYLVGRIFINQEGYFFAEGKNLEKYNYSIFGTQVISEESLTDIFLSLMLFTLDFDLLVPKFDSSKVIESDSMNNRVDNSKTDTGKRIYREFSTDDIIKE